MSDLLNSLLDGRYAESTVDLGSLADDLREVYDAAEDDPAERDPLYDAAFEAARNVFQGAFVASDEDVVDALDSVAVDAPVAIVAGSEEEWAEEEWESTYLGTSVSAEARSDFAYLLDFKKVADYLLTDHRKVEFGETTLYVNSL